MAVKNLGEKFRCNICGNEVLVTKVGGGVLACCGEDMEIITGSTPKEPESMPMEEGPVEGPGETHEEMGEEPEEPRDF